MNIRAIVDKALKEMRAEIQHRYDYYGVDIHDGRSLTRGPVFTGDRLQAEDVETAINTTLYDFGQKLIYELCDHQWVDARNEVIASGNYCSECNMMRRVSEGQLAEPS